MTGIFYSAAQLTLQHAEALAGTPFCEADKFPQEAMLVPDSLASLGHVLVACCFTADAPLTWFILLIPTMPVTLTEIVATTRLQVEQRKREVSVRQLQAQADKHVPRGFRAALEQKAAAGVAIIAEIKKASPSKGVIRGTLHVAHIAQSYERHGAAALSVLTEEHYFQGSLANLVEASAATQLPCLRKDFIVDEYQLLEALAYRADAVLLLASVLPFQQLLALDRRARELGLDVLCEVHDETELERALALPGEQIIGVNNRDLRTFQVDLNTAVRLAGQIPRDVMKVAESGIQNGQDIGRLRAAGYQAFLVGESLMKADDPGEALGELLAESCRYQVSGKAT